MIEPKLEPIEPSDVYGPSPDDEESKKSFEEIAAEGGFSDDEEPA